MFRRIALIYVVFYSKSHVTFQLFAILYTNLAVSMYQGYVKPFDSPIKNKIELFNEFMV